MSETDSTASWVLIVGASSAIGKAMAQRWAAGGKEILLAGRDLEDLNRSAEDLRIRHQRRVEVVSFDALDFPNHQAFWDECLKRAGGRLDGVMVLHGMLPSQADAQVDLDLLRRAIDTNFTSVISLLTLAANEFERRRSGFLCVFSSVAGDRGRQSNYVYGAAKAGLTTFLAGLRVRMFKCNVAVITVKPGFVDTAMTWGLPGMFLVANPAAVAADVWNAVGKRRGEIYTPWFWHWIMMIIRWIPGPVFNRMKM